MTKKILVVDDQPLNRTARVLGLKLVGYQVDQAASGIDALKRVIADNYDVILMDYDMPFMSGPQCTQKIREYETGTVARAFIIGITSKVDNDIEEKCLNAGMDACMDKASSTDEIQKMLKEWPMIA